MDQAEKGQGPMDPPQSWLLCASGQILCLSVPLYHQRARDLELVGSRDGSQDCHSKRAAGLWGHDDLRD